MLRWLRQQPNTVWNGGVSNGSLAADFAVAVTRHGDEAIIASLIRCGADGSGTVVPALDLMKAAATLAAGPQRLSGGTEYTPARPGTEATPVRPGTEITPGTGTEFTPGTGGGTESTPAGNLPGRASWGEFEVVLGPLVAYAAELRAVGTLTETGLE